ncbi:MAG: hypothetical protein H0V70_27725 [Ktedonobacteraceae bacterium]|nr:hypothetical protein [Ktedonobacteraceae bacterium]
MSNRTIELKPNEIIVNGQKRMLIQGSKVWSYKERQCSARVTVVDVYYKQCSIVTLKKCRGGYIKRYGQEKTWYSDLPSVVKAYRDDYFVQWTDEGNERQGILQWCQFGPTVAPITLSLTGEEIDVLEQVVAFGGASDVETLAKRVIQEFLQKVVLVETSPLELHG